MKAMFLKMQEMTNEEQSELGIHFLTIPAKMI